MGLVLVPGRRFIPVSDQYEGNRFFTIKSGVRKATPLLLVLAVVEISDVVFAVDSIPAVRHHAGIRVRVAEGCGRKGCPCLMEAFIQLIALLHAWHGACHQLFVMADMVPGRTVDLGAHSIPLLLTA